MPNIYQPKYEHLLMDPNQAPLNPAKLAELAALITKAGDNPAVHAFPPGNVIANALTTNVDSTVLVAHSRYFTNDILLRVVTTIGATPTVTLTIRGSKDNSSFSNVNYALIATPATLVSTALVITTAQTSIYRIPPNQQVKFLKVTISAVTNVTTTIDVIDFGGVDTNG
jgi:hypothetical protein